MHAAAGASASGGSGPYRTIRSKKQQKKNGQEPVDWEVIYDYTYFFRPILWNEIYIVES